MVTSGDVHSSAVADRRVSFIAAVALLAVSGMSPRAQPVSWPDTFVGRLEVLAVMQTLNAELLASRSATQTLEKWCGDHRLADEPRIVARVVDRSGTPLSAEQRERLKAAAGDEVRYRRVQLQCGSRVLSEADNWYLPARLTTEMNRLLETTGTPFGTVVRPLEPFRQTLAVTMLWSPLPERWDRDAAAPPIAAPNGLLAVPDALFAHRAVLYTRDHMPFSEVYEVYQRQLLAFPPPVPR
jgi:chorismate-pyruvate lyase